MQSVGSKLREARERKGYSLDEIGARTRINARNLTAIEHDQVTDISSPFFYRSFVRQYAEQVDLDFQVISSAVELLAGHMRQPDLPGQGEHPPVRVAPIQARPKRDFSWLIPTAVFLGVVVLGSGGYAAWKLYKPFPSFKNIPISSFSLFPKVSENVSTPAQTPVGSHVSKGVDVPGLRESNPAPIASDRIHLELAATERTWLTVSADGKPAYTGTLEPAEKKILEGQQSARLRTGNAGGVNIIFNGKPIGSIGPRGKTRTVVFTRTGYAVEPEGLNTLGSTHIGG